METKLCSIYDVTETNIVHGRHLVVSALSIRIIIKSLFDEFLQKISVKQSFVILFLCVFSLSLEEEEEEDEMRLLGVYHNCGWTFLGGVCVCVAFV